MADRPDRDLRRDLVYVGHGGGHRRSYVNTLCEVTSFGGLIAPRGFATARRLFDCRRLLFATFEDDAPFCSAIALARAARGRPTAALLMGAARCFVGGGPQHAVKYWTLRGFRSLPPIRMLSILPFYLDERFGSIARNWIYDPQFWDLAPMIETGSLPRAEIADAVRYAAAGRPILLFLGVPSSIKGYGFLHAIVEHAPDLASRAQIVIAGRVRDEQRAASEALRSLGAVIVDRYLSDDEVIALKRSATAIWACYEPGYDSSSGMFGRSLQLGKQVILRRASLIERIAREVGYPAQACRYGDVRDGARAVVAALAPNAPPPPDGLAASFRAMSIERIGRALA